MWQFDPDLDVRASRNQPMPIELDLADQLAYQALCHLYARFRKGDINKQNARSEKTDILDQWSIAKSQLVFLSRDSTALADEIQEASDVYENDRTLENADRMYRAFWGREIGKEK